MRSQRTGGVNWNMVKKNSCQEQGWPQAGDSPGWEARQAIPNTPITKLILYFCKGVAKKEIKVPDHASLVMIIFRARSFMASPNVS